MPNHLKFIISTIAVLVAVAMFWLDTRAGAGGAARWIALTLGPLAVFAIWIFPETKAREIRKAAAQRQSERANDGASQEK
ncbi:MAG: hypothetical protein V3T28_05410 [Gemmatimonadales bacterium]